MSSRINQPPVPQLPNTGRLTKAEAKVTTAPRQAAAQPQTRAAAKDGFAAAAATPMVLNPELQRATVREVLPQATQDPKQAPTRDQVKEMVLTAFRQQFNGTRTPTDELLNQWIDKGLEIFNKDGTTQFLTEKLFSELNKAVSAGRTSPVPTQDFKQAPTRDQVKEMVLTAFKQQYNGTRTPTDELLNQWIDKGLEIFNKDGTAQFLTEKLFSELNKAVSAGRTSPLPTEDFKSPVTDDQLRAAVEWAFKQQFNGTHPPSPNEMKAWMAEAKKIAEKDGTTQFLQEKVFSALNKAASQG